MVRTIHQNSKDCLGSFGLIGNYTDVCVQVTGDDARRAGRQRCSGRPARKAPGALRFVCRGGFEWIFKAGPLPKDSFERNVFGIRPRQAAFALAIRSHDSAHVRQV